MTSYEIGSNSSRYPYDYSFVTDGTNSEYTDTTESSFILPIITGADADKFLQVNAQATGYEYTAVDAELPPQAGQAGKFLETNGSSVFWDTVNQVPGATAGVSGYLLTNNGSTASWTNGPVGLGTTGAATPMLWFGASNNGFAEGWSAGGGATGISAITNGAVCCTFQSGAIRLPGGNPIRSNGNAASRFQFTSDVPNIQNSVTAGTTGTDRNVSVVSTNWSSSSLDSVCSYTQDNPGALVASSMALEIKNNQILFTGAGTNASTTLPTRVTRMTIDNTQVTVAHPLIISNYVSSSSIIIATTGFVMNQSGTTAAQAYTFRNFDSSDANRNNTNRQGLYSPAIGAVAISTNSVSNIAGSTAGRPDAVERFRVDDNFVTVTNSLNLTRVGSAAEPTLIFNDNTATPAASRTGIWGTDDNIFFSTGGVQRFSISNVNTSITGNLIMSTPAVGITGANGGIGVVANLGATSGVYNTASTNSGIRFETFNDRTLIYSRGLNVLTCERSGIGVGDEGIVNTEEAFVMKKAMRTPIMDRTGNFTVSISTPIVNRILVQPSSNITITLPHLTQSWLSGQQHVFIPYRDTNSGATSQVFLGTGQTAGTTGIQLHIMHNNTRTVVTANNTYEIIEGGVYTCIYHHLTPSTCIWYIWIDGLLPPIAPQVSKKTVVIASNSSTAYVYDSGNTAPATTLISNSIQSTKNITLGNMGASYDGFEFEFMLTGDLNNFGVAVTLSLAGSYVKVRSGAIGVDGSTAGQVHTFSRPMNEFRITGVFVWNGGTNPYWVVVDRGVYKQRATNDTFAGGTAAYNVTRNTPEDLMITRDSNTTIDFKNLVTEGGSQEDYDGFNFWLSSSANVTGSLSFKNSTSVSIVLVANGGISTITAGTTSLVLAANAAGSCYRCVFRNNSGFKWFIYGM